MGSFKVTESDELSFFVGGRMEEFKIYSITDKYISYLQKKYPNVYSNKMEHRTHTRKYIGTVMKIEGISYYIPMSSPKESDYQIAGKNKVIKKSIVPIFRIVVKNSKGEKELKGTLRISHMIPVPESELIEYDINSEPNEAYRELVKDEWIFIRKNREKIINYVKVMYKQKCENFSVGYVKSALDYKALEKLCKEFDEYISEDI